MTSLLSVKMRLSTKLLFVAATAALFASQAHLAVADDTATSAAAASAGSQAEAVVEAAIDEAAAAEVAIDEAAADEGCADETCANPDSAEPADEASDEDPSCPSRYGDDGVT